MQIPALSRKSVSNRRIYMVHQQTLIDFSKSDPLKHIEVVEGIDRVVLEALRPDAIARGTYALRLRAEAQGGTYARRLKWRYVFGEGRDLSRTPVIAFAFSPYDGPLDSTYFEEVAENKYFVEKPDPLLISHSRLSVTAVCGGGSATETVALTQYGFNRIFADFSGAEGLHDVRALEFTYYIEDEVPGWQRICKLDTVFCGRNVDFTFKGAGMEALCAAEHGTVLHRDGVLTYTAGKDSRLTLPDLTDAADTVCDVYLPVKNTVWLCLDASVRTLRLRLGFKTDEENFFSEDKQKTLDIERADERHMVAFNLSDCPKAVGRLTGLAIEPILPDGLPGGTDVVVLHLWKVAFEQEKPIRSAAGCFLSCTADEDRITFVCRPDAAVTEGAVEIYDVFPSDHGDTTEGRSLIAEMPVSERNADGTLTIHAPFFRGNVTRLASEFLGVWRAPDGTTLPFDERIVIENWADFCPANPWPFEVGDAVYDVTDFGAYGDGFHDDTAAIQAAIDRAAEGGGVVRLPGTPLGFGHADRRYLVTNLYLRSFVELRIETGAVLWQSDDLSHYAVLPRFGHNTSMTGINWPANHTSGNYPLIYAWREACVRITGGGTIRMCDTESHSLDGEFAFIGDNVCIGCCDRLHVIPVGLVECERFEIRDLTIIRSSAVYIAAGNGREGYLANLRLDESKCTGADGIWPCGTEGVVCTRILMNNNDDGLCLSANYNDPRDMLWSYAYPGSKHGTGPLQLSHSRFNCYTFTASAVSFCTWGTDAPDLSTQEVHDIEIFDTVLEGRLSVGGWTDNPYFGKTPFDGSETDDFSPVKNLTMHHCEFRSPLGIQLLRITHFRNDFDWPSPSQFEYGDFRRRPAERLEGWTAGLSNWSYDTPGAVQAVNLYGVTCAFLRPVRDGVSDLYQGLTLSAGAHTLRFRYKGAGRFEAFVRAAGLPENLTATESAGSVDSADTAVISFDAPNGGVAKDRPWQEAECRFHIGEAGLYEVGVRGEFHALSALYATDFRLDE